MSYMESMSEERLILIKSILEKTKALELRGGNAKELYDSLLAKMTLGEVSILGALIKRGGQMNESELDSIDHYLTVLEAIGLPLNTKMSDITPAQEKAIEDSKEDMDAIGRVIKRWNDAK